MKYKLLITIIGIGIFNLSIGQTLRETKDWLKNKIENYSNYSNTFNLDGGKAYTDGKINKIEFLDDEIIIFEIAKRFTKYGDVNCRFTTNYKIKINFNKISAIEVDDDGIRIRTAGNNVTSEIEYSNKHCTPDSDIPFKGLNDHTDFSKTAFIRLDYTKEENLKQRFEKAVKHLLTFIPKQNEAF